MAQASAERVMALIAEVPEIRDSAEVLARVATAKTGDGFPATFQQIQLKNVGFQYRGGPAVLEHFDLTVKAGETVALVGSTGGGKSTIVNLICRFYEPTSGEILFDGVDYRQRSLSWLHSNLGIVLQTPHLFGGNIRENIRYGHLAATDEEVLQASELAGAHTFIERFVHGYETEVGEGGVRLSMGEKQLISFARAILASPQILVMDEATSSVDTETEQQIQRGMAAMLEGCTSFVIAHRLSTIRSADRILVIEQGSIQESGTHTELLALRGRYHNLYTQQRLREVEME